MEHFMTDNKAVDIKEFRKSKKKYDLVIDKGRVLSAIIVLIILILGTLFMFYLADVF